MERLRFAPSPTGPLHIGGLRTALFNYLYALKNKGQFILRIEDTDQNRIKKGSEKHIIESLRWCGIAYSEGPDKKGGFGPYRQSERGAIYSEQVSTLLDKKKAYYAFDSSESLNKLREEKEANGEKFLYSSQNRMLLKNSLNMSKKDVDFLIKKKVPYVIRLKVEGNQTLICKDELRNAISFNSRDVEDKILIKSDGFPTYHFANVVDDHLMKITTVIRGEEWLPSLPFHSLLYEAFNWKKPKFLHLPLILKPKGKGKLSKRDGGVEGFPVFPIKWVSKNKNIYGYKEKGFLASGLINYISQLGWSFTKNKEIYSLKGLIPLFEITSLQKGSAKFDYEKAKWVNAKHIQALSIEKLISLSDSKIKKGLAIFKPEEVYEIYSLIKERMILLSDDHSLISFFYKDPQSYLASDIKKINSPTLVATIINLEKLLSELNNMKILKDSIYNYCKDEGVKFGHALQILRLAIIGSLSGPDIIKVIELIGKISALRRLKNLKNFI